MEWNVGKKGLTLNQNNILKCPKLKNFLKFTAV